MLQILQAFRHLFYSLSNRIMSNPEFSLCLDKNTQGTSGKGTILSPKTALGMPQVYMEIDSISTFMARINVESIY